jgi:hypothetical protein
MVTPNMSKNRRFSPASNTVVLFWVAEAHADLFTCKKIATFPNPTVEAICAAGTKAFGASRVDDILLNARP